MPHRPLLALLAIAAAGAPILSQAAPAPGLSAEAARGRDLYFSFGCNECHGDLGQGGAGPRLAPQPRPAAAITAYVRDPLGDMPPFTDKLASEADLAAVHAYLSSIPPPSGGPGKP